MDNPQHYQPLSHALQPIYAAGVLDRSASNVRREEEEEDDGDEGLVEEQLHEPDPDTANSSRPKASSAADAQTSPTTAHDLEVKRRPGRPRGSKNRKPRANLGQSPPKQEYRPTATGSGTAPPQLPDVNAQNQQYYELQWRVLNLCAEFYGAAEELIKGTPPLVLAQCYQMGPGAKVDPIVMLNDAKRVCDTLVSRLNLLFHPIPCIYHQAVGKSFATNFTTTSAFIPCCAYAIPAATCGYLVNVNEQDHSRAYCDNKSAVFRCVDGRATRLSSVLYVSPSGSLLSVPLHDSWSSILCAGPATTDCTATRASGIIFAPDCSDC